MAPVGRLGIGEDDRLCRAGSSGQCSWTARFSASKPRARPATPRGSNPPRAAVCSSAEALCSLGPQVAETSAARNLELAGSEARETACGSGSVPTRRRCNGSRVSAPMERPAVGRVHSSAGMPTTPRADVWIVAEAHVGGPVANRTKGIVGFTTLGRRVETARSARVVAAARLASIRWPTESFSLQGRRARARPHDCSTYRDRRRPRVHVEADEFFYVRGGYLEPWLPESHPQNVAVMQAVAAAASTYAAGAYTTVVDGIISPKWFLRPLAVALAGREHAVSYAILRPTLATCIARGAARSDGELSDPGRDPSALERFRRGPRTRDACS
jgi:hypothetical protein